METSDKRGERARHGFAMTATLAWLLLLCLGAATARAQNNEAFATLHRDLLAKAAPDECYDGIGNPYPPGPPCNEGGVPKVNQAYIWGLTKSGNDLWFGTIANTPCMLTSGLWDIEFLSDTAYTSETKSKVCEGAKGVMVQPPSNIPKPLSDWRSPKILVFNTLSNNLVDKTPADDLIENTMGIRSAGALGDVVLLAGPTLSFIEGINVFAFRSDTCAYLGSAYFPQYYNIRKWVVIDGVLYTAVGNTGGGGSVLRWRGDANDPFQFEVVGDLDAQGVDLAAHEGRLFVTTWPNFSGEIASTMAGLWMSPVIPVGGLTAAHAGDWRRVWKADDYEPDPITALTYGGGPLASFDGYLYWGTLHVPFVGTLLHIKSYGYPETEEELVEAVLGTWRALALFRGRDFASSPQIQLLYGETRLLSYSPPGPNPLQQGEWQFVPNNMGLLSRNPLYGSSGFDDFFNTYAWAMAVYDNQLFVGTMDTSYSIDEILETLGEEYEIDPEDIPLPPRRHGADLYRFISSNAPATPESLNGVGNYTNYGIRSMLSDDALYIGTANPMNLLTDPDDDLPEGGWELIKLATRQGVFPGEGTRGTAFSLKGSGFGEKKPQVTVGGKKCKVLAWTDGVVHANLRKKLKPGKYDVVVKPKGKSAKTTTMKSAFTVMTPEIDKTTGHLHCSPGDEVTISGAFFSTKKGKVRIKRDGMKKAKKCRVLNWTMEPLTGRSTCEFKVPGSGLSAGTYDVIVSNNAGADTWLGCLTITK